METSEQCKNCSPLTLSWECLSPCGHLLAYRRGETMGGAVSGGSHQRAAEATFEYSWFSFDTVLVDFD